MSAGVLTFTEKDHRYEVDGEVIPSVTQIMELAGIVDVSGIPAHHLQRAADRGTAVHVACQYLDEDDLVIDSLDPEIVGYVVAYQRFKEQNEFVPDLIEHRMVGEVEGWQYGMTLDRLGTVAKRGRIVLDLKTSSKPSKSWPIQTAAYVAGYSAVDKLAAPSRGVVHLHKDGTFSFLIHDQEDDFTVWVAAVRLAYWKLRNGYKIP